MLSACTGIVKGKSKNTTIKMIHTRATALIIGPRKFPNGKSDGLRYFRRPKSSKAMGKAKEIFASRTLHPTRALKAVVLPRYTNPRIAIMAQHKIAAFTGTLCRG